MNEEQVLDALNLAVVNNNFEMYRNIVCGNIEVITNLESDFWKELYSQDGRQEIKFWIEFEDIPQSIHHIALIPRDKDDLFYHALDYEVDMDGVEAVIDMWRELIEEDPVNNDHLLLRIKAIQNHM